MNIIETLEDSIKKRMPKTLNILKIIGFIMVFNKIFKSIAKFYELVLRRRINLKKRYGENSWAFITGSSEGIYKNI